MAVNQIELVVELFEALVSVIFGMDRRCRGRLPPSRQRRH
jgi:hypothetical protein